MSRKKLKDKFNKKMATKISSQVLLLVATIFFIGCETEVNKPNAKTFVYDFSTGKDGWQGGFADHPDTTGVGYNLVFKRTGLPAPLNTSKQSLLLGGTNRSDDLLMFIKRKITDLSANTTYKIRFVVEFASNVPTGHAGVGGPPDAVFMKVGATLIEPQSILDPEYQWFRMNIDHGQQSQDGRDMINIGTIGVADNTTDFTLISRNNNSREFVIETDSNGEVWVIICTESGFEYRTELYFNKITITFSQP